MLEITLIDGTKAAIFAPHVASIEYRTDGCIVVMVNGTRYETFTPTPSVVDPLMEILRKLRG